MLKYGIPHVKSFYDNDVRFLEQFRGGRAMKVPLQWLGRPPRRAAAARRARRAALARRRQGRGRRAPRPARRRRRRGADRRRARARGRQAPERRPPAAHARRRGGARAAPDRVRRLELRRRRHGRGRAAGHGAARRPHDHALQAARRDLRRHDPVRARARHLLGGRGDHGARRHAGRPGEPLAARVPLAHDVLELEVTSNRADLLSMRGVARDVHAIFGIELTPLDESEPPALGDRLTADWIAIAIEDEDLCPRFTARVFQDVTDRRRRRSGSRRACRRPACARSRTSSTSRTT